MIKCSNKKLIEVNDWDKLVTKTYKRPYCFQQQGGCQSRGVFSLTVPSKYTCDKDMHDSIPEEVNGDEKCEEQWEIDLFWTRNFYPDIHTVANDLYKKGLLEKGEYAINIDW
jgi:hypothetical protein